MERTFRLRQGHPIAIAAYFVIWIAFVLGVAAHAAPPPGDWTGATYAKALLAIAIAFGPLLSFFLSAHEVRLSDSGTLEVRDRIRSRLVPAARIAAIDVDDNALVVRHDGKATGFLVPPDAEEFVARLLELNPEIELSADLRRHLDET